MSTTTGLQLFDAGYTDLVSVIPPGAKLSPNSDIPDGSVEGKPDQRGKAPGKYDGNRGNWAGYNWREFKPQRAHIELWQQAGANIGLHARHFPAIDIDCLDKALVEQIEMAAYKVLGGAPVRIGRAPKALLVYRTDAPFTRLRLHLQRGELKGLIEILGDGQQYLVAGVHPGTMKPYEWDTPLHEWDFDFELNTIDLEKAEAFLAEAEAVADMLGWETRREGKSRVIDESVMVQEALRAPSFEACEAAVRSIPNTSEFFPSRDSMNQMGYAIKASVGEEGLPLFLEWCASWADGVNDPEYCAHEWDRMVPPFRIGWEWLVAKAKQHGYDDAGDDFEAEGGPAPQPEPSAAPGPAPADAAADPDDQKDAPPSYSDLALARIFGNDYGDRFRYVEPWGGWLLYEAKKGLWSVDEKHKSEAAMQRIARAQAAKANNDFGLSDSVRRGTCMNLTRTNTTLNALKAARSDRRVASQGVSDFDVDPFMLNTPAGLLDLRTGAMKPHDPKNYCTVTTAVAPKPGVPVRWLAFLDEALEGDQEVISYVQTLAGYWLTGSTKEQQLAFLWGPGGNGKGVFAGTIGGMMGGYSMRTPSTTFASTKNEAHPEAMARLRGARLVLSSETQEGQAWDEAKMKGATGGDVLTARHMHQGSFQYKPQFKLVFLGNHKPRIRNLDAAMKRRIHLLPMINTPKQINRDLEEQLREEWPQILQWAIDGCTRWVAEGLRVPKAVMAATSQYFFEEDVLGRFLDECTTPDPKHFESSLSLHGAYMTWAKVQGEPEMSMTRFSKSLDERPELDKRPHPITRQRGFFGAKLLVDPNDGTIFETQPAPESAKAK